MKIQISATELGNQDQVGVELNKEGLFAIPKLLELLTGKLRIPLGQAITIDPIPFVQRELKKTFEQLTKTGKITLTIGKQNPKTVEFSVTNGGNDGD